MRSESLRYDEATSGAACRVHSRGQSGCSRPLGPEDYASFYLAMVVLSDQFQTMLGEVKAQTQRAQVQEWNCDQASMPKAISRQPDARFAGRARHIDSSATLTAARSLIDMDAQEAASQPTALTQASHDSTSQTYP